MEQTKQRYFIFIDKLQDSVNQFTQAAIPELIELNLTDNDPFKRQYLRMKSAVLGQILTIKEKANQVFQTNIENIPTSSEDYYTLINLCKEKRARLDDFCYELQQQIEATAKQDFEIIYQQIIDEYNGIKEKFHCSQCSSPIEIDKIYFTTTYLKCESCQTKNTFEPSSKTKLLEDIARQLAEQRTEHLFKEYEQSPNQSSDIYHKYLRAMFDQWNLLNPTMQEEHEKFYKTLIK